MQLWQLICVTNKIDMKMKTKIMKRATHWIPQERRCPPSEWSTCECAPVGRRTAKKVLFFYVNFNSIRNRVIITDENDNTLEVAYLDDMKP